MKCQICCKRKAKYEIFLAWAKATLNICEKCRRAEAPTAQEQQQDELQEMYRSERQAEFDACYVDLDY